MYALLVNYYTAMGDIETARRYSVLRQAEDPFSVTQKLELIRLLEKSGDTQNLGKMLDEYFEINKANNVAMIHLANYAADKGDIKMMRKIYDNAIRQTFAPGRYCLLLLETMITNGDYAGAKITPSSVREYETAYAAHILGYVGNITAADDYWGTLADKGYAMNDKIGRSGAEAAFEDYLRGTDGVRVVSMNEDGKVTGEYYSTEPVPGATVELTVDLDLQQAVEDALAATIQEMDRTDPNDRRGGAAVVLDIDTREVLAMASYPTYDLSTFRQPEIYAALNTDTRNPFNNRATQGQYAPGSTIKPLTAVAALEEEAISSPTERLRSPYVWYYPNDPTRSRITCDSLLLIRWSM